MLGHLLGNYRVLSALGRSDGDADLRAFAVVHEHTKHRAVLLVLARRGDESGAVFQMARALATVRDPGLIEILDCDLLPDSRPYVIQELAEGESVRQRLDRFSRLPELSALLLSQQLCAALLCAHRKGVAPLCVHPERVVILPDPGAPGEERAKLLLCSLSRLLPEPLVQADAGQTLDEPVPPARTGSYLAPEEHALRAPGEGPPPPPARWQQADVFAVGLLLYEMLTGWHPFGGLTSGEMGQAGIKGLPRPQPPRKIDPALREEVEALVLSMIAARPEDRPHMERVLVELQRLTQRPTQELHKISDTFGKYRVVRNLGEGGMGKVFLAVNDETDHHVAIKVLHEELAQLPQITARFFNEARTANRVRHPGIVSVYELGQLPDRPPYIVMEYLDGESLAARLIGRGGTLRRGEALSLLRQVADVMAAAHDKGVIHRDLKPENVMLVRDPLGPQGERIKILDFGIAKVTAFSGPGGGAAKTKTGTVLGTPLYMAPEQCRGTSPLTERVDVYSLGVMAYQLLSGRVPFSADATSELMAMHLYSQPTPLSQVAPGCSRDLEALVQAMMAKAHGDRPPMRQVAAEIRWMEQQGAAMPEQPTMRKALAALLPAAELLPMPPFAPLASPPGSGGIGYPAAPAAAVPWAGGAGSSGAAPGSSPGALTIARRPTRPRTVAPRWVAVPLAAAALAGGVAILRQSPDRVDATARRSSPSPTPQTPRQAGPATAQREAEAPSRPARPSWAPGWTADTEGLAGPLYGLWGNAPNDIFAVGAAGAVLHYDGTRWEVMHTGTPRDLYAAWGQGADLFVVGEEGTVLHHGAEGFRRMRSPSDEHLNGVWGSRWDDVYAVGQGVILHYDGHGWRRTAQPGLTLNSVWGTPGGEVHAVGSGGVVLRLSPRFSEARWARQTVTADPERDLLCVGGTGPDEVWAMGHRGAVLRYDGARWAAQPLPAEGPGGQAGDVTLFHLWPQPGGEVVAVGSAGGAAVLLRRREGVFSRLPLLAAATTATMTAPMTAIDTPEFYALWGGAGSDGLLLAGKAGTVLRYR